MISSRKRTKYAGTEILSVTYIDVTWDYVRIKRNLALEETDWRFMSDQTPSQEWIDYRQFLRDLPQNYYDESDEVSEGANAAVDAWVALPIPE